MKNLLLILFFVFPMSILIAQNFKVDELMGKYFKVNRQDKLSNILTVKVTGKILQKGSVELKFTNFKKRPNKDRTDWEFMGLKLISVIDGETGWMVNPISGSFDPQDLSADVIKSGKETFGIQNSPIDIWNNPLLRWKDNGNDIEIVGKEDMSGTSVYNLRMTFENGDIVNYYMDVEKLIILKMKQNSIINGQLISVESISSDYRNVDGFMIPYKLENFYNGNIVNVITVDEIELNLSIDESIFKKPGVEKK